MLGLSSIFVQDENQNKPRNKQSILAKQAYIYNQSLHGREVNSVELINVDLEYFLQVGVWFNQSHFESQMYMLYTNWPWTSYLTALFKIIKFEVSEITCNGLCWNLKFNRFWFPMQCSLLLSSCLQRMSTTMFFLLKFKHLKEGKNPHF